MVEIIALNIRQNTDVRRNGVVTCGRKFYNRYEYLSEYRRYQGWIIIEIIALSIQWIGVITCGRNNRFEFFSE